MNAAPKTSPEGCFPQGAWLFPPSFLPAFIPSFLSFPLFFLSLRWLVSFVLQTNEALLPLIRFKLLICLY